MTEAPTTAVESPLLTMPPDNADRAVERQRRPRANSARRSGGVRSARPKPGHALAAIRADLPRWTARIREIADERPTATGVRDRLAGRRGGLPEAARLFEPAFAGIRRDATGVAVDADRSPAARDPKALADQASTSPASPTTSLSRFRDEGGHRGDRGRHPSRGECQCHRVLRSPRRSRPPRRSSVAWRGARPRALDVSTMGPVVTIMVGRLDDRLRGDRPARRHRDRSSRAGWAGVAARQAGVCRVPRPRSARPGVLAAAIATSCGGPNSSVVTLVLSPAPGGRFQATGVDLALRFDIPSARTSSRALGDRGLPAGL